MQGQEYHTKIKAFKVITGESYRYKRKMFRAIVPHVGDPKQVMGTAKALKTKQQHNIQHTRRDTLYINSDPIDYNESTIQIQNHQKLSKGKKINRVRFFYAEPLS